MLLVLLRNSPWVLTPTSPLSTESMLLVIVCDLAQVRLGMAVYAAVRGIYVHMFSTLH